MPENSCTNAVILFKLEYLTFKQICHFAVQLLRQEINVLLKSDTSVDLICLQP